MGWQLSIFFAFVILGVTLAQNLQGPAMSEAQKAGAAAGGAAGAAAGARAGAAAAAIAGMQAIRDETPGKTQPPGKVAEPMKDQEWVKFEKSDPGTVKFFKEFDADENKRWNQIEYMKAMHALKKRGTIPKKLDVVGVWNLLPKANGELLLRDFIAWAAKTRAASIPRAKTSNAKNATGGGQEFRQCREIFDAYDKKKRGSLTYDEYKLAVAGKIPDNEIKDNFYKLPRTNNMITYDTFTFICSNVFGLPTSSTPLDEPADPCEKNPCRKKPGTICVADPKRCISGPCPQFKCLKTASQDSSNTGASTNAYGQCVNLYKSFDKNGDGALTYQEFDAGVKSSVIAGIFPKTFRPFDAWNRFDKDVRGRVNIYEFIHFCVSVTTDADDFGASAREECWDVFTHFDENRSQDLSAREFFKGMRRARRTGHLAADLNFHEVWRRLPKTKFSTLEVGPFIDFCVSVSKGDDPVVAARDAQPMPEPLLTESEVPGTPPTTSVTVSTVGMDTKNAQFCESAFLKANRQDNKISRDSFRVICSIVASESECSNYTTLFAKFDINKDGFLAKTEFIGLCKASSVVAQAGDNERSRRLSGSKFLELESSIRRTKRET